MKPRILRDLIVTYRPNPARVPVTDSPVTRAAAAAAIFLPRLQHEPQEVLGAIYLDTKLHVIAYREIHRGTLAQTYIQPRDILIPALLVNASAVIIAHNHPSGDPTPTTEDLAVTRELDTACRLLGVDLLDHLVIGDGRYVSLKETGRL